jgi:hypothetical protein
VCLLPFDTVYYSTVHATIRIKQRNGVPLKLIIRLIAFIFIPERILLHYWNFQSGAAHASMVLLYLAYEVDKSNHSIAALPPLPTVDYVFWLESTHFLVMLDIHRVMSLSSACQVA